MCKTDTVSDLGWFRGLVFNTMCTSIIYSSSFTTYSQAYKYLDIDTVTVILAICQLNKLNIDVHTFIWFTSKLSEQCSDYSTFYIGQLDSPSNWTVGCSVVPWPDVCYSLIISLTDKQINCLNGVGFMYGICICNLLRLTLNTVFVRHFTLAYFWPWVRLLIWFVNNHSTLTSTSLCLMTFHNVHMIFSLFFVCLFLFLYSM